jgi:hypothetical protein
MNIYRLMVNEGIVYPAVYKRIKCNTDITTKKGLKALLKKLRGSVQKDASFFISVGAEGKTSAVFIITCGYATNKVFSKELLTASILSQSSEFIIVTFFSDKHDYDNEIVKQDFSKVKEAFDLLELHLIDYYTIVENVIHCITI